MKTFLLIVCLVIITSPTDILAAEIPLPELVGEYTGYEEFVVQVDFGQPIEDMSQVLLEINGIINPGWMIADGDTYSWGAEFVALFLESDTGLWASGPLTDEYFSDESIVQTHFEGLYGATSDFLSDGLGEMTFYFVSGTVVGMDIEAGASPTGTILSAKLIFEEPVETESHSWGSIKSLFR